MESDILHNMLIIQLFINAEGLCCVSYVLKYTLTSLSSKIDREYTPVNPLH